MATPQALAHYEGEARRAVDDVNARRAAMRKAIKRLIAAEIAMSTTTGNEPNSREVLGEAYVAQMAVEQLIGEMR